MFIGVENICIRFQKELFLLFFNDLKFHNHKSKLILTNKENRTIFFHFKIKIVPFYKVDSI